MKKKTVTKVCVTGGAGFIASWLMKKLLEEGHTVHATLRDLEDRSKVEVLKSFSSAKTGLVLFQADIYDSDSFDDAIKGCEFVFKFIVNGLNSSTTLLMPPVAAAKSIGPSCVRSCDVRRLIYTASVVAASLMKEDGSGFKDAMDEACSIPLNV